ncbi:hypothetical protein KYK30_31925 [Shinella yambaruensis]|uniref:Uncharacterized protein n=1 Tax=Shinella yambaruensis TaxID=415996 RepID=A0ABQ5ZR61_9HYPH|nr:hypothetical protein [Shinella yambaruensis]MCJ8030043.1 hypothetical protein [Shinella yambaruensis]MCU7984335.1 hypothetical protein [Shinella yambaruensis]GLR55163.1 hypothetical protein GCM10007923_63840 [Shinella yambaruensis]
MSEIANPRYCPTAWLDEVNPLGDTPEAFARTDGETWRLVDPDEDFNAAVYFNEPLEPGQIVNFARLTTYGDFVLTIREDGTHYADLPEFDGHPGFRLENWEYEDVVDELSELIRVGNREDIFSDGDNPLPPGSYTVECWAWQDTIPFRFEPADETPKFVLCAGGELMDTLNTKGSSDAQ